MIRRQCDTCKKLLLRWEEERFKTFCLDCHIVEWGMRKRHQCAVLQELADTDSALCAASQRAGVAVVNARALLNYLNETDIHLARKAMKEKGPNVPLENVKEGLG